MKRSEEYGKRFQRLLDAGERHPLLVLRAIAYAVRSRKADLFDESCRMMLGLSPIVSWRKHGGTGPVTDAVLRDMAPAYSQALQALREHGLEAALKVAGAWWPSNTVNEAPVSEVHTPSKG